MEVAQPCDGIGAQLSKTRQQHHRPSVKSSKTKYLFINGCVLATFSGNNSSELPEYANDTMLMNARMLVIWVSCDSKLMIETNFCNAACPVITITAL